MSPDCYVEPSSSACCTACLMETSTNLAYVAEPVEEHVKHGFAAESVAAPAFVTDVVQTASQLQCPWILIGDLNAQISELDHLTSCGAIDTFDDWFAGVGPSLPLALVLAELTMQWAKTCSQRSFFSAHC